MAMIGFICAYNCCSFKMGVSVVIVAFFFFVVATVCIITFPWLGTNLKTLLYITTCFSLSLCFFF